MNFKIFFFIFNIFSAPLYLFSQNYGWPTNVNSGSSPRNRIIGTIGEFRGNNLGTTSRFHQGVDFSQDYGTEVYAMSDGTFSGPFSSGINQYYTIVETNGTVTNYVHTQGGCSSCAALNTYVTTGTRILTMKQQTQVHVHIESGNTNILEHLGTGAGTYLDNAQLNFSNIYFPDPNGGMNHGIRFNRNGLHWAPVGQNNGQIILNQPIVNNNTTMTLIFGKIDIETHVVDPRTEYNGNAASPTGQMAPLSINYRLHSNNGAYLGENQNVNGIVQYNDNFIFDFNTKPNSDVPAQFCFSPLSVHPGSPSVHIITSDPIDMPYDRYLNTMLRAGVTQEWPAATSTQYNTQNAFVNDEAEYPDGIYSMEFTAQDVDSDANNPNNQAMVTRDIVIDNFKPYIKSKSLIVAGYTQIEQVWNHTGNGNIHLQHTDGSEDVGEGDFLVRVIASEPIIPLAGQNQITIQLVPADNLGDPVILPTNFVNFNNSDTEFHCTFDRNQIDNNTNYYLDICARDYAGNELLHIGPTDLDIVVPHRNDNGTWSANTVSGCDYGFNFSIDCNSGGNIIASSPSHAPNSGGCIYADFSYTLGADGYEVTFDDNSSSENGNIISRTWQFGDGVTGTTSQPSHAYASPGCYDVTLIAGDGMSEASVTKEVCIPGDQGFLVATNGPTQVAAGNDVAISATPIGGLGPFSYNWSVSPSWAVWYLGDGSGQTLHAYTEEESGLVNGDILYFDVEVTDVLGNTATATHPVIINGNLPDVELVVFGAMDPLTYLDLVAFVDFWNITGTEEDYRFYVTQNGPIVFDSDLIGVSQAPIPLGLPIGNYTAHVEVSDELGTYSASKDFVIGNPPPPPPPAPAFLLMPEEQISVNTGENINLWMFNGNSSFFQHYTNGYTVSYNVFKEEQDVLVAQIAGDLHPTTTDLGTTAEGDEKYAPVSFQINEPGCYYVKALICPNVCGTCAETCVNGTDTWPKIVQSEPCLIEVLYVPFTIESITSDLDASCQPYVIANISGGLQMSNTVTEGPCENLSHKYKDYDWRAYDVNNPDVVLENFFEPPVDPDAAMPCIRINMNHPYIQNFQGEEMIQFRCQVSVTDYYDFVKVFSTLMTIAPPLKLEVPDNINICAGTSTSLAAGPLVSGGLPPYDFQWSLPPGVQFAYGDNTSSGPEITAPVSGSHQYAVTVTDANNCSVTKTITVTGVTLNVDLGPSEITACVNNSLQHIGPAGNIGGSGNYVYEWTSDDPNAGTSLLSDPATSHPTVETTLTGAFITYTLTVTDLLGGCTASDQITVKPGISNPTANAGQDQFICYGNAIKIGDEHNGDGASQPQVSWSSDNPAFQGDAGSLINLPSGVNENPGTWTYTVTVIDGSNGCFSTDDIIITVEDQWIYNGYNAFTKPLEEGNSAPAWDFDLYNNKNLLSSGFVLPLVVHWFAPDGTLYDNQVTVTNTSNNNGVPREATFTPTESVPFLYMEVTDKNGTGCTRRFQTNKYLLFKGGVPVVTKLEVSNPYDCSDNLICFDIEVATSYSGINLPPLPSMLGLNYELDNPEDTDQAGSFFLSLTDAVNGIYSGTACFGVSHGSNEYPSHLTIFENCPSYFINDGNGCLPPVYEYGEISVLIPEGGEAPEVCNYCSGVAGSLTLTAIQMNVGKPALTGDLNCLQGIPSPNCTSTSLSTGINHVFGGQYILVAPQPNQSGLMTFIELKPATIDLYSLLMIDPCLEPENMQQLVTERNETQPGTQEETILRDKERLVQHSDLLEVFPNPFTGDIQIRCHLTYPRGIVSLRILDPTGNLIESIFNRQISGNEELNIVFDGGKLPAGLYLIELLTENGATIEKIVKIN